MPSHASLLRIIARDHLDILRLKTRNSDALDFHNVSVWGVESALNAAFKAGAQAALAGDNRHINVDDLLEADLTQTQGGGQ